MSLSFEQKNTMEEQKDQLNKLFLAMKIKARCVDVVDGLRTRDYYIKLELGEKVSRVKGISQEIALALRSLNAPTIELEPSSGSIKIVTTTNNESIIIPFNEVIQNLDMNSFEIPLLAGIKMDRTPLMLDLAHAPHLLVAGTTGAGKSVLVRSMIEGMIYKRTSQDVSLCLFDPKLTELQRYSESNFCCNYSTDYESILNATRSLIELMEKRYEIMSKSKISDFKELRRNNESKQPYVVVIIEELADILLQDKKDRFRNMLIRLLQKSRAAGIHIIANTQRPSREIVCGLIKANMPIQIALKCSTGFDSRTILGEDGAENLVGKGDMLVKFNGRTIRAQATFI